LVAETGPHRSISPSRRVARQAPHPPRAHTTRSRYPAERAAASTVTPGGQEKATLDPSSPTRVTVAVTAPVSG